MNIHEAFENFLENHVNLNSTRIKRIEDAKRVFTDFIKGNDTFKDLFINATPQGSSRQGTIIKPNGEQDSFDADLLISLEDNLKWSAADYHSKLADIFKESDRYKDITDTIGKTRCVTIDYEGDFHVDLVPGIVRKDGIYVCNKSTDEFELSDGEGYALWFEQQDGIANNYLVLTVRLLKYLRDFKGEFDTKSIILTTIAGYQVSKQDTYMDLPHTLVVILNNINSFLSQYSSAPSIINPAMPGETFDRHWKNDKKGFQKLKSAIAKYSEIAQNAIDANEEDAIKHWQNLFGDNFGQTYGHNSYIPGPTIITNPIRPYANDRYTDI